MARDYLDFDLALTREGTNGTAYAVRVVASPVGEASAPFVLPFQATELAQFMVAVGPPREVSRRLVPGQHGRAAGSRGPRCRCRRGAHHGRREAEREAHARGGYAGRHERET